MFDIAFLRCLPNIVLMAPRDEAMLVHMLHTALCHDGPAALRYPRGEGVGVELPAQPLNLAIGTGEILREAPEDGGEHSHRVALLGYGTGVGMALAAADLLELELLVTVEEGVLGGGFGSAVWETLNEAGGAQTRIVRVGVPDRYVTHGAPALLHEEIGFTPQRIAERVLAAIDRPTFAQR